MVASAFPLADVLLRSQGDRDPADPAADRSSPKPDELPFPPAGSAGGEGSAGAAAPGDASSVQGPFPGLSSSGSGSALLDQVLGAARLAGHDVAIPPLPLDKLTPVDPLRVAILDWISATHAEVPPEELAAQLARADALPQDLQRDLAIVILSAAEATRLQREATALLTPEQLQWIHQNPEAASDLARGIPSDEAQALALMARLVDTQKSLQAALLVLQATEATRGSLAGAAASVALDDLPDGGLDPATRDLLRLLAEAGSQVSDADKVRFAARVISTASGVPVPEVPAQVTFAGALDALLAATGQRADAAQLADVLARAGRLPADLQRALALPVWAQARAVDAANPLGYTSAGQTGALLGVLAAVAESIPTLEKYHLYWRNAPEALRVSTWDERARLGWAAEHAAMLASTRGDLADLVRAGGLLQGAGLVDASVPDRDLPEALDALLRHGGVALSPSGLAKAERAADALAPDVRAATARMVSGAAEAARLTDEAYAALSVEERDFLLARSIQVHDVLAKENPSAEEIALLARFTALAALVDRDALVAAGVVGARATAEAAELLSGSGALSAQSAGVSPVDEGLGALLARLLPFGAARAQAAPGACQDLDDTLANDDLIRLGDFTDVVRDFTLGVGITNDCESDVYFRVTFIPQSWTTDVGFVREANGCTQYESSTQDWIVVTGSEGTVHEPAPSVRRRLPLDNAGNCDFMRIPTSTTVPSWGAPVVSLDLGGSDTYTRPVAMTFPRMMVPVSLHLDAGGTEFYADPTTLYDANLPLYRLVPVPTVGHPTQGAAVNGGVAVLVDASGNDRYEAPAWSQGFGRLGVGILADLAGGDSYAARNFTQGAASESGNLALGMLLDAGGDDSYAAITGQGYGAGGVLVDLDGRDAYFADDEPRGVPVVRLEVLPGGDVTALNERKDGRVWIDGPASLHPGVAVDVEATLSGRDQDGDGDSDFVEFLAGSDPRDPESRATGGPSARVDAIARDADRDLFPDFVERALSTDPQDPRSYPVGFPVGPTFVLPLGLGTVEAGQVGYVEGAPQGGDKILDLRLPLQDAGSVEPACIGARRLAVNVSLPYFMIPLPTQVPVGPDNAQNTANRAIGDVATAPDQCAYASYSSDGQGGGASTVPGFGRPEDAQRFTFSFPAGILAVGDSVRTSYDVDYFVVLDLGGDDTFRNRAGGALPVRTVRDPETAPVDSRDNAFLAPSLVLNVDVNQEPRAEGVQVDLVENPGGASANDRYLIPANGTGRFTQGSLLGVLVDVSGNDQYVAGDGSQGALGGVLLDLAGSDTYAAGNLSQGASLTGGDDANLAGYPDGGKPQPTLKQANSGRSIQLPALLLDYAGSDRYVAGAHSQGFARGIECSNRCAPPTAGILLDAEGVDKYDAKTKKGFESQGVGNVRGLGVLMDLAGGDTYSAWGLVSQGATISDARGTPPGPGDAANSVGAGVLADLGGDDLYSFATSSGDQYRAARHDNLTVERRACCVVGDRATSTQLGVHLDGEKDDAASLLAAVGGHPSGGAVGDLESATTKYVDLPTARLAIGGASKDTYDREYALVVDLGGENEYAFNAGGFVPDVLVRHRGTNGERPGGGHGNALTLFPVSLVFDAGTSGSTYTASDLLAQGAGFFSVGLLVDAGGDDRLTALPRALWSGQNDWKTRTVAFDGRVTDLEWGEVESRPLTLRGMRDARYEQRWTMRVANDERNLYLALEGPTDSASPYRLSCASAPCSDRVVIDLNPGHTRVDYDRVNDVTGVDELRVEWTPDGRCVVTDWHWHHSETSKDPVTTKDSRFVRDRSRQPNVEVETLRADWGCIVKDGRVTIEIVKPFDPTVPADTGDAILTYDEKQGFLNDLALGFRVEAFNVDTGETYAFPPGSTRTDGDFGHRADGSLNDEMAGWAATALANKGERTPAPPNARVASLSQGAGLAGVGIVAMLGTYGSGATYDSADRSQAFAAYGGFGLLLDAGGNDVYKASDLSQAAALDSSVAALVDLDGHDRYASFTNSNGFVPAGSSASAVFVDLHGYDDYETPGFSVGALPNCAGEVGAGCELEPGVRQAKGNQKSWRHSAGGVGVDFLSNDDVRGTAAGVYEDNVFGPTQTRIYPRRAPANGDCDALPAAHDPKLPYDPASGSPILSGKVCLVAKVDLTQRGAYASALRAATKVSIASLDFLVDGAVLASEPGAPGRDVETFRAALDTTQFPDGVRAIGAVATFAVTTAGRGTMLYVDNVRADPLNTSHVRAILNNAPDATLALGPCLREARDGTCEAAYWSPNTTQPLHVDWSVTRDGAEDRLAAVMGYEPPASMRNVPCERDTREPLCHVLPFYFKKPEGNAQWDTTPGTARPAPTNEQSTNDSAVLSQTTAMLKTPLVIHKEDGLVMHLPDRRALLSGDFYTTVKVTLYDQNGNAVTHGGSPVFLVNETFHSYQVVSAGDTVANLVRDPRVENALATAEIAVQTVQNTIGPAPVTGTVSAATAFLCPGGWADTSGNKVACQQIYGSYGTGTIKLCHPTGTHGAAAGHLQSLGLCGKNSAVNLTMRAAADVDETPAGQSFETAMGIVDEARRMLSASPPTAENWTVFRLPLRDHAFFAKHGADARTLTIPPGYSLHLETFTTKGPIERSTNVGGDELVDLQDVFAGAIRPAILDLLDATGDAGNVSTQPVPPFIPPFSGNVTALVRSQVEAMTLGGFDGIRRNPIYVSSFTYGHPDSAARLDVRVPAEPATRVNLTFVSQTDPATSAMVLNGTFEGDLPGTPTHVTQKDGVPVYVTAPGAPRFTQRTCLFPTPACKAEDGATLPDGVYNVTLRANDTYSGKEVARTATLVVDGTAPSSLITSSDFVGVVGGAAMPVAWSSTDAGAGVAKTYVYYATSLDAAKNATGCSPNGRAVGGWRLLNEYPAGIGLAVTSGELLQHGVLWFLTLAQDRAGNLESGDTLCQAVSAKVNATAYRRLEKDSGAPVLSQPTLDARLLPYQGRDFGYVRPSQPLTFEVCAADSGGRVKDVQLVLFHIDPDGEDLLTHAYDATRQAERGHCGEGFDRWSSSQWSKENGNATLHPDGVWAANFEVFDEAGNRYSIPAANLILDSRAPTVALRPVGYPAGQSAARAGDLLSLRVTAEDAFGVDGATLRADASALNRTGVLTPRAVRVDGVSYQEFTFRVDKQGLETGDFVVPVEVADNAGNVFRGAFNVTLDLEDFEIVEGSLRVTNVTHESVVVRWTTTRNATSAVRYGLSPVELREKTPTDANLTTEHAVLVKGLTPSTRYHFRVASSSAGGFTVDSNPIPADTLSALFLRADKPAKGDAVSGVVDVAFEGGLLGSNDFVTYTLHVGQPHKAENWTFVTTSTRQGDNHTIRWNSSRYLDGEGYRLRLTAEAGDDKAEVVLGPFLSDNGLPALLVVGPAAAVNDSTPVVHVEARDAFGFGSEDATLRIDGREVASGVVTERTSEGLRIKHDVPSALSPGAHRFEVSVVDRAGNRATKAWEVFVDSDAPVLRENPLRFSPGLVAAKADGQVVFNLTIRDASGVVEVLADASELRAGQSALRLHRVQGTDFWTGVANVTAREDAAEKRVRVTAVDRAGNSGFLVLEVPVDNRAPRVAQPDVLDVGHTRATLAIVDASEAILLRAAATAADAPPAAGATTELSARPRLTLEGLLPSRTYQYEVRAVDGAGNEALLTGRFSTLADTLAPGAAGGVEGVDLLNGTLRLTWAAAEDDVGVAFYRVYRSGDGVSFEPVAEVRGLRYEDGELPYEKAYTYQVVAVDHGGNEGPASERLTLAATAVPTLTGGTVSPTVGSTSTVFRYAVTYASAGGVPAASVRVVIGGVPHEMTATEGGDPHTGVTYVYETRLAPHTRDAPHTYAFEATDGRYTVKLPIDGTPMRGPLVSPDSQAAAGAGLASFAQRVPLGGMAGVTLALVAAALVAALVVRKKKEGSK